ncbi:hypothetical protein [Ekhidna sp.]|uniref:hypothetical protein n=1 Tax=Ekhidna sp. TaxID=2608089 RepID=UPI003C7D921A
MPKKIMEEKETNFGEWADSLTVSDVSNVMLIIVFSIVIIWLVVRTFRNKPSA